MKNMIAAGIVMTLVTFNLHGLEIPFAQPQAIGGLSDVESVCAADLDGDGDPDLVTTGSGIGWHKNSGTAAAWTEHQIVTDLESVEDVEIADLDHDGSNNTFSFPLAGVEQHPGTALAHMSQCATPPREDAVIRLVEPGRTKELGRILVKNAGK